MDRIGISEKRRCRWLWLVTVWLFALSLTATACVGSKTLEDPKEPEVPEEPEKPEKPEDPEAGEVWAPVEEAFAAERYAAVLDMTGRLGENELTDRNLYSAEYMLEVAGLPTIVTDNLAVALAESRMIVCSSPIITGWPFSPEETAALRDWVAQGGVLVLPAVGAMSAEAAGLTGIASAVKGRERYGVTWTAENDPELVYFEEPNERNVSLGSVKSGSIQTFGYALAAGEAIASFDTGETAVVRHRIGEGRVYTFGLKWRDVIQRSQLNKDFGASRAYSNDFEPSADSYSLFLRAVYGLGPFPVSVWKHTIPKGFRSVLIPTHDCDSRTAYDEMHYLSDYEHSLGLRAHYFLTTHYYRDAGYLSAFYDEQAVQNLRRVVANGHTIGSHSVGHFPDFSKTERFPMTEISLDAYSRSASHNKETGVTTGGSTWAELILSKQIIERDLGCRVRSFRSGHLCMNKNIPEAHRIGGYRFSSCYSAGDVLGGFPFRERLENTWDRDFSGVLQMPLHISDVFSGDDKMTENNWSEKPAVWLGVLNKLAANYAPCVLLIHPNRDWKMFAQRMLIESMDRSTIGLYNFEEFGEFWNARRDFTFEYCYLPEQAKLLVRASRSAIDANPDISFGVDLSGGATVREAVLMDENGMGMQLHVKPQPESGRVFLTR